MFPVKNSHQDSKKGDKMKHKWSGPYEVCDVLDKGVYHLMNSKGKVLKKGVNQCRLKQYYSTSSDKSIFQQVYTNSTCTISYL